MIKFNVISHKSLFLIGWMYYLALPITFSYFNFFNKFDFFDGVYLYLNIENVFFNLIFAYCLVSLFMYLLGSGFLSVRVYHNHKISTGRNFATQVIFLSYLFLLVFFAFRARELIGFGYQGILELSPVGPISTLQLLILYQYIYEKSINNNFSKYFALLLIINSIVLLSMGGRLYVLSALVTCYVRWWNCGASNNSVRLYSFASVIGVLSFFIYLGMWRVGEVDYSLIAFYISAESIFTSISSFTLFQNGGWSAIFDFPGEFIISFANIIPSAIWHNKAEWLSSYVSGMQNYETPMGAVSIVASTVSNFGFVGGLLFFMGVGFYMTAVSRTRGDPARESYYYYLIGFLPFMFFRDPFQVQIKVFLTGFILYLISVFFRRRHSFSISEAVEKWKK